MKRTTTILFTLLLCLSLQAQDFFAVPSYSKGRFVRDEIITHTGYITSWNSYRGTPNWVAWELTEDEAKGEVASRKNEEFIPDPMVRNSPVSKDYSYSGYDRGHMAPAADFKWSAAAMSESFYLSNVCPQNRELNSGLWLELEQKCRVWAKKYGSVYICAGPFFGQDTKTIGQYGVSVPIAFYKTVLFKVYGHWECIAFVMDNKSLDKNDDLLGYAVCVAELEKSTGLIFYPQLEDKTTKSNLNKKYFEFKNWKK